MCHSNPTRTATATSALKPYTALRPLSVTMICAQTFTPALYDPVKTYASAPVFYRNSETSACEYAVVLSHPHLIALSRSHAS